MRPPSDRSDMAGFFQRLSQAYYRSQMTQEQLGKAIGKSRKTVELYLTARATPDAQTLMRICEALNVSADWILFGDEGRKPEWWI